MNPSSPSDADVTVASVAHPYGVQRPATLQRSLRATRCNAPATLQRSVEVRDNQHPENPDTEVTP